MKIAPQSMTDEATGFGPYTSDLAPGSVLNNTFRIRHAIAEGGMGTVYLATHERLPGLFVVKTPRASMPHTEQLAARLRQEAHVLASLNHPNIVRVFDFNETPAGTPYLVMEFLDGRDLNEVLHARPLRPWEVSAIVRQVACALSTAHACNIVHRDLKPENVLIVPVIGRDDIVKVIDFGVSKLSGSSRGFTGTHLVGTPDYMAPEQAHGDRRQVDARTDQFALAVMTYEMLARKRPFVDEDPLAVLYQIVYEAAPPLADNVNWRPTAVEHVLRRGMEKDPAARYANVREFSEAFDQALYADIGGLPEALQLFSTADGCSQVQEAGPGNGLPVEIDAEWRVQTSVTRRPPAVRSVVSPTIRIERLRPRRRRRHGRALSLVAGAVAAGVLLWHSQVPPAIVSSRAQRAEFAGNVQALLVQTRANGPNNSAGKPENLQLQSSDSSSAQPLLP